MGRKLFSHGWVLYKKSKSKNPRNSEIVKYFSGQEDTKEGLAHDLLIMEDVPLPSNKTEEDQALADPVKYLESLGYVWEELPGRLQHFS